MSNRRRKIEEVQKQIGALDKKIQNLLSAKSVLEAKLQIWKEQEHRGDPDFRSKKPKVSDTKESGPSSTSQSITETRMTPEQLVEEFSVKSTPLQTTVTPNLKSTAF